MKKFILSFSWLIIFTIQAQSPQLLKDINTVHTGEGRPFETVTYSGNVYFIKDDGVNGSEVWRTDGTTTEKFTDIDNAVFGDPYSLTVWNGKLYFSTDITGVWESDGTAVGTTSFTTETGDIIPASTVLYLANEVDKTLYVSDPVAQGADVVYTLNHGSVDRQYTVLGDGIFFIDNVPGSGNEVVYSDGTANGTVQMDLYPGTDGSWPGAFTAYNGKMYFYALKETPPFGTNNNGTGGKALYESDGSIIGTTEIVDFGVFSGLSSRTSSTIEMTVFNNKLYYYDVTGPTNTYDNTELYTFDGVTHSLLHTFTSASIIDGFKYVRNYNEINGTLYFNATDNGITSQPRQTDGATVTTSTLNLAGVSEHQILGSNILYQTFLGGETLSSTDLAGNVTTVFDHSNSLDYVPSDFSTLGGSMFYIAADDVEGIQLWKTDGTNLGTSRVTTSGFTTTQDSNPYNFTVLGSSLLFNATSAGTTSLYTSDGTSGNTLEGVTGMTILDGGVEFNGEYYYSLGSSANDKLMKTDGSSITEIQTFEKLISNLTVAGGKLYFTTNTIAEGTELWVTDGTVDNGAAIDLAVGGTFSTFPEDLMVVNNELFFTGIDVAGNGTRSLMKSDGTLVGTVVVHGNAYDVEEVAVAGDNIYMVQDDLFIGKELILFNTIAEGLIQYDIYDNGSTPNGDSNPKQLTPAGDKMYFFAQPFGSTSSWALVSVDGTNADPVILRYFGNASFSSIANTSTLLTFHVSSTNESKRYVVSAINNGIWTVDFNISNPLAIDDILYFVNTSENNLYETDGTDAGTSLVQSIVSPYELINFNDDLYFVSDINNLGKEVYSYRSSNQGFSITPAASMGVAQSISEPSELTIDWVSGGGDKRILLVSQSGDFSFPEDGTVYTADPAFGGSELSAGSGTFVIANDDIASVSANSFTPGSIYHFMLIEYTESTPGDTKYDRQGAIRETITLSKGDQLITFDNPGDVLGTSSPYTPVASTTSGLPISFTVNSGPASYNSSFGYLVFSNTGTVTVTASQAGNAEYNAAADVQVTFNVIKADQVLTFDPPTTATYPAANIPLSASSDAGLSVTIEVVSGPGFLSAGSLVVTGAGDIVLRASNTGNDFYNAISVEETLVVAKGDHTTTINPIADKVFGSVFTLGVGPGSDITSSAPAGNPTGLYDINIISGPATAENASNIQEVTITGVGTVTFEVVNLGNDNWNPAPTVQGTFEAIKASQTVSENVASEYKFSTETINFSDLVTSSTGQPVSFVITDGPGFFSGAGLDEYNFVSTGQVTVSAFAASSANYESSPAVDIVFTILKGDQTVTWSGFEEIADVTPGSITYSPDGFTMVAESGTGLDITYSINSGTGTGTITGDKLDIATSGSFDLRADQAGDANWNAAFATYSVTVNKADQTITFEAIEDKVRDTNGFAYAPTSSSGLEVSVSSSTGRTSYDGSQITFVTTSAGQEELILFNQGDANYLPAQNETVTFCISAPAPTLAISSQTNSEVTITSDNNFDSHEFFLDGNSIGIFSPGNFIFSDPGTYTATALASDGCPVSEISNAVVYEIALGLYDENELEVFPVPATDFINIRSKSAADITYKISDLSGRLIMTGNVEGKVDVKSLKKGVYLLQLVTDGALQTIRFSKE
ncbi:MAG: T9SS type A sorting domain-containing protein [Cyclobacteriaceae bacterium]